MQHVHLIVDIQRHLNDIHDMARRKDSRLANGTLTQIEAVLTRVLSQLATYSQTELTQELVKLDMLLSQMSTCKTEKAMLSGAFAGSAAATLYSGIRWLWAIAVTENILGLYRLLSEMGQGYTYQRQIEAQPLGPLPLVVYQMPVPADSYTLSEFVKQVSRRFGDIPSFQLDFGDLVPAEHQKEANWVIMVVGSLVFAKFLLSVRRQLISMRSVVPETSIIVIDRVQEFIAAPVIVSPIIDDVDIHMYANAFAQNLIEYPAAAEETAVVLRQRVFQDENVRGMMENAIIPILVRMFVTQAEQHRQIERQKRTTREMADAFKALLANQSRHIDELHEMVTGMSAVVQDEMRSLRAEIASNADTIKVQQEKVIRAELRINALVRNVQTKNDEELYDEVMKIDDIMQKWYQTNITRRLGIVQQRAKPSWHEEVLEKLSLQTK